jgi:hypothetical protein
MLCSLHCNEARIARHTTCENQKNIKSYYEKNLLTIGLSL